jgi:phosphoribosylaminoimidazolecarboxamide formyltransferase/IMP cyclohydrolase
VDAKTAEEIDKIFVEAVIAPSYDKEAATILKQKKNRIILIQKKKFTPPKTTGRAVLNGGLLQESDFKTETEADLKTVTKTAPTKAEIADLLFANKIAKHSKSNAIVLAKNGQLVGSGVGQTSRVDALKQAITKARSYEFDLKGAVMASDAFFPFADCAVIARNEGVTSIIQPGGSIRDNETIEYCDKNNVSMVFTGTRHFKH